MKITPNDLRGLVYDPARMQKLILSQNQDFSITNSTNPFIMLMEASGTMAAAASIETIAGIKKIYPNLATTESDIINHVSDAELVNIFSYPATTNIVFYLNVRDLKNNGSRSGTSDYVETYIQSGTEVVVTGIPFTLLNDIRIRLYDSGSVFAEQITTTDPLGNNSIGILPAGIINFQDGEPWVAVETILKQLKKSVIIKSITASEGFTIDVKHTDKYHHSSVSFRSSNDPTGAWTPMAKSHDMLYLDPDVDTVFITVLDGVTRFTIPDIYLIQGRVTGEIQIILYETLGYLDLPIYKYQMSEYKVSLNTVTTSIVAATIANIAVLANSRDVVNGGISGFTFEELRHNVINNTLGHTTLPITNVQLAKNASLHGFDLFNIVDIITQRLFIATKNITKSTNALVYSKPDIFFNTVSVKIADAANNNITVETDRIIIPSGTLFKNVNGITSILTNSEVAYIGGLTRKPVVGQPTILEYLSTNNIFFTPYYYLINTALNGDSSSRVYDLDTPTLKDIKIAGINTSVKERCNVGKFSLKNTGNKYILTISIIANDKFVNPGLINGQLSIDVGASDLISFAGAYDSNTKLMTFEIGTKYNITTDDTIELTMGVSNVSKPFCNIVSNATIYLYTTDDIGYTGTFSTGKIITEPLAGGLTGNINVNTTATVLDKETVVIEFARNMKYIWNKVFTTYTANKYKTYATSVPMVYQQDVYDKDPVTGSYIFITTDPVTGVSTAGTRLLHAAGTDILDASSNLQYVHTAGSIVLDAATNLPIIDNVNGVVRNADILMLEYEYKVADSLVYTNYLDLINRTISYWLLNDLELLNQEVLENTRVLYKSYKTALPVEVDVESVVAVVPYNVKPVITLYTTKKTYTDIEMNNLTTGIGSLLHDYLDKQYINLSELKNQIIDTLDSSIVNVRFENIETYRNSDIFTMNNPTNRLTLAKKLVLNSNNKLEVVYDITVNTHYI